MRSVVVFAAVVFLIALAVSASAGGKASFTDYYYSAKTLIGELNALAAEVNRAGLEKGISAEKAEDFTAHLVKAREGFSSLITSSEETNELNESYITYIDRMLICVSTAVDYGENPSPEKRKEILEALAAADDTKDDADSRLSSNKTKYGVK
ncbi:MAG: hypothetical protein JSW52_05115 [Candidatus Coatesbacteria bacterium]|nr:MAG: hypothetical protein JSW52_05115 [Candidatus Coatesbacteria bacterium]